MRSTTTGDGHHELSPTNDRPLVLLLAGAVVLGFSAGTELVAWWLNHHPNLGPPALTVSSQWLLLFRVGATAAMGAAVLSLLFTPTRPLSGLLVVVGGFTILVSQGRLYPPYMIAVWQSRYAEIASIAAVLKLGWALVGITATSVGMIVLSTWRRRGPSEPTSSHGSAQWSTGELLRAERGLILGRQGPHLLRFAGEGHVLTVAPTRSGKGVSCVIPNLLDHPGSVLVTDPKGENFAVTARWRRETGQRVHAFDPFLIVGGDAALNPLDLVDSESPEAGDDARMLADMIVLQEGRAGEQVFWNEEARAVLTGLILHVAASAPPELRNLAYVRHLLTLASAPFASLLKEMSESDAAGGLVARAAARILQKADRERSGVISTAQSHTHFLDSPRMTRVMRQSTMDLAVLKREPASVYLVLPTDRLDAYARWLRIMIACALLAIARDRGQPKERVLFLLDEFAHLGKMHPVLRDIGLAGGFGVAFWLIVQDLSQLKSTYGEAWPTFLANADVLQAFGTNDWETAEYLSKLTGDATIRVASENQSQGVSRGKQSQRQQSMALTTAEKGRRLLLPDEVRRLERDAELLFVKAQAPILTKRVSHLIDPEFEGRADRNPLYANLTSAVCRS